MKVDENKLQDCPSLRLVLAVMLESRITTPGLLSAIIANGCHLLIPPTRSGNTRQTANQPPTPRGPRCDFSARRLQYNLIVVAFLLLGLFINPRQGLRRPGLPPEMARVYADVNQHMPRAYWDYDSVNISWGVLENYEVVRKIGALSHLTFVYHAPTHLPMLFGICPS